MEFSLSENQKKLVQEIRSFAQTELAPIRDQLEEDADLRKQFFYKLGRNGLLTLTIPEEYQGRGIDHIDSYLAVKEMSKWDAGIGVGMGVANMVAETILHFGNSHQKKVYLPKLANGQIAPAAFSLTEKQAGSDPKAIQTHAKKTAHGFTINGAKQFVTNGDACDLLILFAKTAENEISAFLVEKGNFEVVKKELKMGLLTLNLVDLALNNCHLPKDSMLGNPGDGLKIALWALDSGRIGISAQALGIAEAAFQAAVEYANRREQFGSTIIHNQGISFKLVDMLTKLEAGTLLMEKAAWLKHRRLKFTTEAAIAKLFCSEACNQIAYDAIQIHGAYGYVKDYPLERYYRDARATTLYEGTSEIQKIVISRSFIL